jgi:uncharacterized DUF497 family protein
MFSWNASKAVINQVKHKVSFKEATAAFAAPHALEVPDIKHSQQENSRFILGLSDGGRVRIVVCTIRRHRSGNETIRIIGARQASPKERKAYARQED